MIDPKAILYYADNPVDFVEDIIRAKPDPHQRDILNSIAKYPKGFIRLPSKMAFYCVTEHRQQTLLTLVFI